MLELFAARDKQCSLNVSSAVIEATTQTTSTKIDAPLRASIERIDCTVRFDNTPTLLKKPRADNAIRH